MESNQTSENSQDHHSEGSSHERMLFPDKEEYDDFLRELEEYIELEELYPDECVHSIRVGTLCGICGKDVGKEAAKPLKKHKFPRASSEEIKKHKKKAMKLYKNNKLVLILDLDQTIIHTTLDPSPCDFHFTLSGFPFFVKTRPYLHSFLKKLSKLYEIHVYTMGTEEYAAAICSHIDPKGKYFSNRIRGRKENSIGTKKYIEKVTLVDRNVVILDDRADVWNYVPNLVMVRPFWYYNRVDINDPKKVISLRRKKGVTTSEGKHEAEIVAENQAAVPEGRDESITEKDEDELKRLYKLLKKVHAKIFSDESKRSTKKGIKKWINIKRVLKCRPLRKTTIASMKMLHGMVKYLGGSTDGFPLVAIESQNSAQYFGVPNVKSTWLFEMAYKWKAISYVDFLADNDNNGKVEDDKEFVNNENV